MAKSKKLAQRKTNKTAYKRLKLPVIIIAIITIILLPFQIPQYNFYYAVCGFKQPIKIVEHSSQNHTYLTPDSPIYKDSVLFVKGYYCSEQAAVKAGYEKNKY